jgi:hypothetical protein
MPDAPEGDRALVETPPPSVDFTSKLDRSTDLVHVFANERASLANALGSFRDKPGPQAIVWVSWPKKSAKVPTDIAENTIRELALPLGFVDVKVCAVDDTWSGLRLLVRNAVRQQAERVPPQCR